MKYGNIIYSLATSDPATLSSILNRLNREAHSDYNWDSIAVKASFKSLLEELSIIQSILRDTYIYSGEGSTRVIDSTGKEWIIQLKSGFDNLEISKDFLSNPPSLVNPNTEKINIPIVDWSKPLYTAKEVKELLQVSDNTFKRWLDDGWISYSQIDGSDKKYIQQKDLKAFLENPKIFKASFK